MADWRDRPRYEGGRNLAARQRARVYARKNLVPNSVVDVVQNNTASNPAPPNQNGRIKTGLLSEWWFDEGSGNLVKDRAFLTNTTDLTLSGDYVWETDPAYSNRSYLSMSAANAAAFNLNPDGFSTGFTLEAWVRPTNAAGLNPGPGRILSYSRDQDGAATFQNFMLGHGTWGSAGYDATNYHARVQVGTEIGFDEQSIQQFTGNGTAKAQLQHVVMTVNYTDPEVTVKTYVDGELKATSVSGDFGSPIFGCWDGSYTLKIGYDTFQGDDNRSFDGDLFLIAVYDRALTLSEINQNRSEGVVSVTDAYTDGSRLFINEEDLSPTIPYNQTKEIIVEASGTRASNINLVVGASSVSGTYGVDFVIDDTTKRILKNEYTQTFELSTSLDLTADIPIEFYIESATGGNVIQSLGQNIDSYSFTAVCNAIEPSSNGFGSFGGGYTYQLPLGNNQIASLGRCEVNRVYDEDVAFEVSGGGETSGTYAIKTHYGNDYNLLPGTAIIIVPAGQIPRSFDVSCKPEAGVVFPHRESLTFKLLSVSSASNASMTINPDASTITVSSYNPPVDTGSMPTSSDTGCRLDHASLQGYTDVLTPNSGGNYVLDDSNVPESGLVIQGMMVSGGTIKINTDRPIKFVDCVWSGNLSALPTNASYGVQSMTAPSAGYGLEFEYCTFSGMYNSCHIFSAFKKIHRCAFNWMAFDFVKLKAHEGTYTVTENWFGPNINQKSSSLNGYNGMWSDYDLCSNGGWLSTTPHSDMFQASHGHAIESFIFRGNNVESHSDTYDDGTVPPDHGGGNQFNAHWIVKGNNCYLNNFVVENNWFHGAANGWFTFNTQDQSWTSLNWTMKNNYIGGRGDSYNGIGRNNPANAPAGFQLNKVVEGNKWMFHDVETVRLPQEAIDLGTTTQTLNAITLNVNDLLKGVDFLKLVEPGLNESGRMNWLSRATPL